MSDLLGGEAVTEVVDTGVGTEIAGNPADGDGVSAQPEESWSSGLPEAFRENPNFTKYDSQEALYEGHANLAKMVGEKGYQLPTAESEPGEWNDLYSKMGRPEAIDGYQWDVPGTINEETGDSTPNFEIDQEAFAGAQQKMHDAGFTQDQYKVAMDLFSEQTDIQVADHFASQEQQAVEAKATLQGEWGDKFEANLSTAQKAIAKFGMGDRLREMGLGNSSEVMLMFSELSRHVGESAITGDTSIQGGGFEGALNQLESSDAYKDPGHPNHNKTVARRMELYKKKYGNG